MNESGNNNIFNDIGRQISSSLAEGLQTGDFSGLSQAISESVNTVIDEAIPPAASYKNTKKTSQYDPRNYREGSKTREFQERIYNEHKSRQEDIRKKELKEAERKNSAVANGSYKKVKNALTVPGAFNPVGKISSLAAVTAGAVGMAIGGVGVLLNLITGFISKTGFSAFFSLIIFVLSLFFFSKGLYDQGLLMRAKRYAEICGEKMYSSVRDISSRIGLKQKKVQKDIRRMLKKGYFPHGYIDEKETTLMLTSELYDRYLETEKQKKLSEEAEQDKGGDLSEKGLSASERAELESMVEEGFSYVKRLRALNDQIPGEVISEKLTKLEKLLTEIFGRVREHPEQMGRIHKLMEYYLPTLIKLVEAYCEYDRVSVPGEDIIKAKGEIENTIDKINEAFIKLLNDLFQDSVWDVTSDAKVMETMLNNEGW